jgi:hypothetical protein
LVVDPPFSWRLALLATTSWQSLGNGLAEQLVIVFVGLICAMAFWYAYRMNQREITRTLEPRRIELEKLLCDWQLNADKAAGVTEKTATTPDK